MGALLNVARMQTFVNRYWDDEILPYLSEYITFQAVSPGFDTQWMEHDHINTAIRFAHDWCLSRFLGNALIEIVQLPGRTPLLFIEVPATDGSDKTVLKYGHLDKQPPMEGWDEGLGPWTPVLRSVEGGHEYLFGRGGADDGYAVFAAVCALRALADQELPHPRIVMMIECSEESGSPDLPAYVELLKDRIGTPSLVIALDSGAGDYERLWLTTSLRGVVGGKLRVQVLKNGVHSGSCSGMVPDPLRILRQLLDRVEDAKTGLVKPFLQPSAHGVDWEALEQTAKLLGDGVWREFPWYGDAHPDQYRTLADLLYRRNLLPTLTVVGADGLPLSGKAGNVLLPWIELKLSVRLAPGMSDAAAAVRALTRVLTENPPCGATVTFEADEPAAGWLAPALAPWLQGGLEAASQSFFGQSFAQMGEGGTIPFMQMLGSRFPQAQFVVTGVLGPDSNAHGPNERLHLSFAKQLTCCVASILRDHAMQA